MPDRFNILKSPFFVLGLVLLLLNDFYFKTTYANLWTGKISDVAGLFIFPLFLCVLFPKWIKLCFTCTAMGFLFWKLPVSESCINYIYSLGIPIGRTVDITDLLALFILPISYIYRKSNHSLLNINPLVLAIISIFSFCATTIPPHQEKKYVAINKTYNFNCSRSSLINQLNRLSIRKINNLNKYVELHFDANSNLYSYEVYGDTIAIFLDENQISQGDTIHYHTILADFIVSGNDSTSTLNFIHAYKMVPAYSDKNYRQSAIRYFEKKVIKKIKARTEKNTYQK